MAAPSVRYVDISQPKDFNYFISTSTLYLLDLDHDKIRCREAQKVSNQVDFDRYKEHMRTLRKDLFPSPEKNKNLSPRTFEQTIDRLQRLQDLKKLFCRNGSFYLVKKYFTEGVQYVKSGEIHTYETMRRPLDIYISKGQSDMDPKTFRSHYDLCTESERILPGKKKIIHSNTYYAVIAPCHTYFTKKIEKSPEVDISPPIAIEAHDQTAVVTADRNRGTSNERTNLTEQFDRINTMPQPLGSRNGEQSNLRSFVESETFSEPDILNGSTSRGTRRSSTESDRQLKRLKSSTPRASTPQMGLALLPVSPNSLRNEMEQLRNSQAMNGTSIQDQGRAVFAIRKDSSIESYALRSNSTFMILPDNIMTGSFAIENGDMDPSVIEYHGEVQFIREVATFKNGSVFETTLTVQKDLLNELQDPTRKKEKIIVNYFFEFAFKAVEAAYKKFSEMRNTKMIGSCVPAIVPLSDARFWGVVSDAYEGKP